MALFIHWDQTTWNHFQALKSTILCRTFCAENHECVCFHDTLGNGTNCVDFASIIVVFIWNRTSCASFICVPCWKQSHSFVFPMDDFKLIESQMSVCAPLNSAEGASSLHKCSTGLFQSSHMACLPSASLPLALAPAQHPETAQESALSPLHAPFPLR